MIVIVAIIFLTQSTSAVSIFECARESLLCWSIKFISNLLYVREVYWLKCERVWVCCELIQFFES